MEETDQERLKVELRKLYAEKEQLRLDSHFVGTATVYVAIEARKKRIAQIEALGIRLD